MGLEKIQNTVAVATPHMEWTRERRNGDRRAEGNENVSRSTCQDVPTSPKQKEWVSVSTLATLFGLALVERASRRSKKTYGVKKAAK